MILVLIIETKHKICTEIQDTNRYDYHWIIIGLSKHLQTSSSFSVPIIVNQLLYININTTSVVTSNKSGRCVPHNCNITSCTTSCTRSVPEIVRHKLLVIVLAFHATTFSRIWSKLHTSQTATVHSSPLKVIVLEQENLTDVCLVWIASSDDVCVSYQKIIRSIFF